MRRLTIRLDDKLHTLLAAAARRAGVSVADYVRRSLGERLVVPVPPQAADLISGEQMLEIRRLLNHVHKIAAIKFTREVTGWGLREAKNFVDGLLLREATGESPSDTPGADERRTDFLARLASLLDEFRVDFCTCGCCGGATLGRPDVSADGSLSLRAAVREMQAKSGPDPDWEYATQ